MSSTIPAPGLENGLRSHPTSNYLSIRAHGIYKIASSSPSENISPLSIPSLISSHAAASNDVFARIQDGIIILTDIRNNTTRRTSTALHFHAQDMSASRCATLNERVIVAVAGYDGIFCAAFSTHDASVDGPYPLPGSTGYPCVCVDVSEDGKVAAGSMDGRVAIWTGDAVEKVLRGTDPDISASCFLEVPDGSRTGDRITQMLFIQNDCFVHCLLIAWWSGRLVNYVKTDGEFVPERRVMVELQEEEEEGCVLHYEERWRIEPERDDYLFATGGGVFVASCADIPVIVFSRCGVVYYIALESGEKEIQSVGDGKMIKGLTATVRGPVAWEYHWHKPKLHYLQWPLSPPRASGESNGSEQLAHADAASSQ